MKKYISIPVYLIVLGLVFGLGFFIGESNQPSIEKINSLSNKEPGQEIKADFSLFWDAWRLIEQKYVNRSDLDNQKMIYGAISGLLSSLDDPYSVFMEPEDSKKFIDDIKGSFEGIGAEIGIRQGILTVITPLEGNPAKKAGLRAGDKVLKVDDTITSDLTIDEAVSLIRGERGTSVTLLIARDELDETKEIEIIRDVIQVPIINWELKENDIAYIQFYHFTESSATQFRKTVGDVLQSNPNGIVLDLRNNPGGYLEVAIDVASWFLPKRELVVIEDYGNGDQIEHLSKGYEALENTPTIVLINQGSASASEILAGALRDIKGIQIVGKKSFGKGSVQQLEKLRGDSSIKITVAKWLTPSGVCIADEGIMPDVEIEVTEEDIQEMRDPQLEKALEMLKE